MIEVFKNRKRIFAILVGFMMVVGQSGYLSTSTVYGATDNGGAGQDYITAGDDQHPATNGDDTPADLNIENGDDDSEGGDEDSPFTGSEVETGQDADTQTTRGPPEGDEETADEEELVPDAAAGEASIGLPTNGESVLAFTSDIHNASNNIAANRLDEWLTNVAAIHTGISAIGFCGDMGSASAGENDFWNYTQQVMNVVSNRGIAGVYTTGNHEFYNGNYSTTNNPVKNEYKVGEVGLTGDNYIIYCLGTTNWSGNSDNYTEAQIEDLASDLNELGNDKPIIILTHFPLHAYGSSGGWGGGRSTKNADKVIDVINTAADDGKKIVVLWGHNHTVSDSNYDAVIEPGSSLSYNSSGGSKTIQFYYASAGCMSDSEYSNSSTSGSASVKGKGLVITINNQNQLSFTYYDANGKDVTKGGTFTEKDPVNATALSLSKKDLTIQVGSSENLTVTFTPADTTNKKVVWASSNPSVATVADGKVTGVSKGTATITATYADGDFEDSCEVTVTNAPGQGVTPESGKKYVILASDGYALTSEGDDIGYTNGSSGSQQYHYNGLTGEEYAVGDEVVPDRLLWTFTESDDGTGYYIQSQDEEYLNATYEPNQTDGYNGTLKLDETPDVWIISGKTADGAVSGNVLKSTNASKSDAGDKYLTHGNGSEETVNIFTVRSEDNATSTTFYEYDDNGTYIDDDPVTPEDPTPTEGTVYKKVDQFSDGKEYLIVNSDSAGAAYALTNPGGNSSGASMGKTSVAIKNGDVDGDGTADTYISAEEATDIVWKAEANGDGFNIMNGGDYLEGKSGNVKIFNSQQYADRFWTYADKQLKHTGGQNTYVVYYDNGFTSTYNSTSNKIYIYEKVSGGAITPVDPPDDPPAEGNNYKLVDQFTSGKDYLIVSANDTGGAYALTNPGGNSSGASMGKTSVAIKNGDVDGDGTADTYISAEEATDIVWKAEANGDGFNIMNGGDYLEGKSGNVKIFNSQQYADRFWTYADKQLKHTGGQNTYVVYYDNGFTSTYNSTSNKIYIYEKAETVTHEHNFGTPDYKWEDNYTKVKATRTCSECDEIETETVDATGEVTKPASCEAKGETTYTSEAFTNDAFEVQTKKVENIDALGHKWGVWVVTKPATCTEKGETAITCERCGAKETKELAIIPHTVVIDEAVPATCTEPGKTAGSHCAVCKKVIIEQQVIPALGHKWGDWEVTKPATCTEKGEKSKTCKRCGAVETEELEMVEHTIAKDKAVPATCTKPGKTEGSHCSVCGKVIVAQKVIPALGHKWKHVVNKAGYLKDGVDYYQCTECHVITNKKVLAGYANYYVKSFKVKKAKKAFTAKWKKQSKANQKKFNGYQIRYSTSPMMSGAKYVTAGKKSKGKKIKGLAKKTRYFVQVRTYTKYNGKNYYSQWSLPKAVKTK